MGCGFFDAELGEEFDLVAVLVVGVEAVDVVEVVAIGDEDEIEVVEIGASDFSGLAGDFVASAFQGGGHAWVGWVAGVVAGGAGGIDFDSVVETFVVDELAEDDLGGGGAADVSHADEEDAVRLAVVGHWR